MDCGAQLEFGECAGECPGNHPGRDVLGEGCSGEILFFFRVNLSEKKFPEKMFG